MKSSDSANRFLRLRRNFSLGVLVAGTVLTLATLIWAESPRPTVVVPAASGSDNGNSESMAAANPQRTIYRVEIKGAVSPATMEKLQSSIRQAERDEVAALLVVLDTPGGLATSMDDMIRSILSSTVPVLSYVSPPGATCGSAGVFLMYASHIAAMAPATNIGSATPVSLGGGGGAPGGESQPDGDEAGSGGRAGSDDAENMKRKIINHAVAQIRGLAEYHGRNADFAEETVTLARNVTSREALELGAIDLIADNEADFLRMANGREVRMLMGAVALELSDAEVVTISDDFRFEFLAVLSNPNLAYILMMIGVLGILAEVQYPGAIFPGVVGGISLLLGLYAMQTLPISYAGMGLIVLGVIFFILEVHVMSFGLLAIAGLVSFVMGSFMLAESGDQMYGVSQALVLSTGLGAGLLTAFMVWKAGQSMRRRGVTGDDQLFTEQGVVESDLRGSEEGWIWAHSEKWRARLADSVDSEVAAVGVAKGAKVRVVGRAAMVLLVEPLTEAVKPVESESKES